MNKTISGFDDRDADSYELWATLEREHPEYIESLEKDEHALAQIGPSFLGFVSIYKALATIIPPGRAVYDYGCCYAAQAWYFRNHRAYIGVDPSDGPRLSLPNTAYYAQSAEDYLKGVEPYTCRDTFAIVSYVPGHHKAFDEIKRVHRDMFSFYPQSTDWPDRVSLARLKEKCVYG